MKVVLKACSGRRNGKGFGERNHVWLDPASPSLIVHNKATLKQEVHGGKVFNKGYHVWLKSAYPRLMANNEDIPAQEMDGKAPQSGDQVLSNSANPSLLGEISNYEHMCKPSTRCAHASSTLQLEHSRSWEMMSIEDALTCLEHMPEQPSVVDFISVLQKCRKGKILGFITRAHSHLCDNGLEAHGVLGNVLVQMFVECGSLSDAHQVFSRLVHRNESSWTSLIQGYNEYGDFQKALQLFTEMQEDCVDPSRYTFVALLKACAGKKCMERVREIHAKVIREELETDPFIGNSLVSVYAKCGLLFEARRVFDSLPVSTIVSWTALIAGYAEHGLGKEALSCLGQMQLEGMCPNAFTFACCLKACGSIGAIGKGQQIHCVIVVDGHGRDLYVGNALVDMYAKCSLLVEAQEVFNVLPARDVVTWTALIAGYADHGLGEEALNYLQQMQNQRVPMNAVTFVCSLKACGSIGGMERGQVIHIKIVKEGFELDPFVGNALVDMYAKCGSLVEAQAVFDWLPARSVISWNILIAGYSEHGFEKQALICFEQMHREGVCMDAATFICSLRACGSIGAVDMGRELHAEIAKEGFEIDPFVGNSLVDMYAKCSALVEAQEVLIHLPVQNVVAWTAVIAIYAEHGLGKEALNVLEEMQVQGISPDIVTFVYGLQACGSIAALDRGRELHSQIVKHAFERDSYVSNTLVDMYDKCHSLTEARNLFDQLPVRSAASWSALIAGYAENGLGGEALNMLEQMQLEGLSPNAATFVSSLRACGTIGAVDRGQELHSEVVKKGLLVDTAAESGKSFNAEVGGTATTEEIIGNALIDMYAKCGSLVDSQLVFNAMPKRSLMTWNTLMIGFTRKGQNDLVFGLFDRLREEGVQPNEVTFLSVLTACSHAGLVGKGQKYFKAMGREYGINPTIDHYNCMIDLLGRAGQLGEAVKLLEKMPLQPNMATWNTILAACRKWGNVELGRRALECAMRLDENHAAAFISMYNIYADAHMWTDAKKIKATRRKVKAR